MKRSALFLIPLLMGLVSCGGDSSSSQEPELVGSLTKFKEILNSQDLSEFYTKTLEGMYSQEYDVLEINNDEDEKVSSYFNYTGSGMFGFYHDLSEEQYNSIIDENGNVDVFDAIAVGKGYFGLTQVARTMSFSREGSRESEIYNLDITQDITVKNYKNDIWVDNSMWVSNDGIFHYEDRQRLNATIDKDLLFSSISTRSFREIFSKVDLFNTPGNIEHLDKLYFSICRDLVAKSDKEISDFIVKNQITIEEKDEIEVNFVYANDDVDEEELDYIFPGVIKGTLFFDKSTYNFSNFTYEMINKVETYDEDTGNIKLINTSFLFIGDSSRELPHDAIDPIDPTVYEDVAEFLKDVNEQVVPPTVYL